MPRGSTHRWAIRPRRRRSRIETYCGLRSVRCRPSGHRSVKGCTTKQGERPEEKRSQVDQPHGRTGARVHRRGRSRHQSLLRLWECLDGPASPASVPPPAPLREVRLNGFPEVLAEVHRHRIGDGDRLVPDAAPTGFSGGRLVVQPAYSLGPHSVSPLRRLAGGCAPSDPRTGNGAP